MKCRYGKVHTWQWYEIYVHLLSKYMHWEWLNFTLKATSRWPVYLRRNVVLLSSGQRFIFKADLRWFSGEKFCILQCRRNIEREPFSHPFFRQSCFDWFKANTYTYKHIHINIYRGSSQLTGLVTKVSTEFVTHNIFHSFYCLFIFYSSNPRWVRLSIFYSYFLYFI